MNAFERIGLPRRLDLTVDEVEKAERCLAKEAHPDKGGDASDFSEIRKMGALLKVPSSRLKLALDFCGVESVARGQVPGELMDYFSPVAGALEEVSAFLTEREGARSSLGKAMLDTKVPLLKGRLEELAASLEKLESAKITRFAEFDRRGWEECVAEMEEVYRALLFVARWLAQLREATGKIFEALLAR